MNRSRQIYIRSHKRVHILSINEDDTHGQLLLAFQDLLKFIDENSINGEFAGEIVSREVNRVRKVG